MPGFFATMRQKPDFNINVDYDDKLKVTKVWFNVLVQDGPRRLGLAGTGLDLTQFLNRFITNNEKGITPIVVNREGAIQAHPDKNLIDYSSATHAAARSTVYNLLNRPEDQMAMRQALTRATAQPEQIQVFWAELNGQRELFALSCIPELNWYVVTAVDLKAAQVIDQQLWLPPPVERHRFAGAALAGDYCRRQSHSAGPAAEPDAIGPRYERRPLRSSLATRQQR